jgi:hypothetical protein
MGCAMMDRPVDPQFDLGDEVKVVKEDLTWVSGQVVGRCKPVGLVHRYDVKVADDKNGQWILCNIIADRVYPPNVGPQGAS